MHKVPTSLDDADDVVEHSLVLTPKLVESHEPDVCCQSAVQRGLEHEVVCLVADGRPWIDVPGAPTDLGTHEKGVGSSRRLAGGKRTGAQ